ncbi:MAG: uroporphyrinogen decarboxylase family protein [Armatimonadota bacterium]
MTSRERVIKALTFNNPDRPPRHLWYLPSVPQFRNDELMKFYKMFPSDISVPKYRYGAGKRAKGVPCQIGEYTDSWGSVWHVAEHGVIGEVKEYPLKDWSDLDSYELPYELLDEADLSEVNKSCAESDLFMFVGTETRPFERMQFLRGTENIMMDLAYGEKKAYELRDRLHEFYVREMKMWADTDVDGVSFMDDWGSQTSLLISPETWREFFKPLYKEYCDIMHEKGKFVFFHSDGNIESIYPDLIEIGIDAINSQVFCMDIQKLADNYKGKITFWGEIDRQNILPFGTEEDVRNAVRTLKNAFYDEKGGVIAQCEWGTNDPFENICAVFDEWNKLTAK